MSFAGPPGQSSVTLLKKYGPQVPFLPLIKVIVMPDAHGHKISVKNHRRHMRDSKTTVRLAIGKCT